RGGLAERQRGRRGAVQVVVCVSLRADGRALRRRRGASAGRTRLCERLARREGEREHCGDAERGLQAPPSFGSEVAGVGEAMGVGEATIAATLATTSARATFSWRRPARS